MADHTCHAEGCPAKVPPQLFVCAKHWRMVPPPLQRELWRVYKPGQEAGKAPVTTAYLVVQTRCRIAIAEREGRDLTELLRQLATFEQMAAGEQS